MNKVNIMVHFINLYLIPDGLEGAWNWGCAITLRYSLFSPADEFRSHRILSDGPLLQKTLLSCMVFGSKKSENPFRVESNTSSGMVWFTNCMMHIRRKIIIYMMKHVIHMKYLRCNDNFEREKDSCIAYIYIYIYFKYARDGERFYIEKAIFLTCLAKVF